MRFATPNPAIVALCRRHSLSYGAACDLYHEQRKDLPPWQGGDARVHCECCQLWHDADEDCPAPMRANYFDGSLEP